MSYYQRPLRPDELMHYGIIGQRWGHRRYQNPDGTLTTLGKLKLAQGKARIDKKTGLLLKKTWSERKHDKKLKEQRIRNLQKAKVNKDREEGNINSAASTADLVKDMSVSGASKKEIKRASKMSARKLSDKELDARIARLKKEQEYRNLLKDTDAKEKGKGIVKDILEDVGKNAGKKILTSAAIAVGGAAVASMLGYEKDNQGEAPSKANLMWKLLQPSKK